MRSMHAYIPELPPNCERIVNENEYNINKKLHVNYVVVLFNFKYNIQTVKHTLSKVLLENIYRSINLFNTALYSL